MQISSVCVFVYILFPFTTLGVFSKPIKNGVSRNFKACLKFKECFTEVSSMVFERVFQGYFEKVFMGVSRKNEGFFNGVLWGFQDYLKEVHREFLGSSKGVSTRKGQGSFKGVSRKF